MLRSALDARFVLYHHIIRRKVTVDLPGIFPIPFRAIWTVNGRHVLDSASFSSTSSS
jgi:type IV secretion system protein VirB4